MHNSTTLTSKQTKAHLCKWKGDDTISFLKWRGKKKNLDLSDDKTKKLFSLYFRRM